MYELSRQYGIVGRASQVLEALVRLCQKDGFWHQNLDYLAWYSNCGDATTAGRCLNALIRKGIILQTADKKLQIAAKVKESSKENLNNNKACMLYLFESFFSAFDGDKKWNRSRNRTRQYFETMPLDWQRLAVEKAKNSPADRDPYWYLRDEDFLKVPAVQKAQPHWLTPDEQHACLQDGTPLAVCRNPETGLFGTVTQAEAAKFDLTIKRTL